MKHTPKFPGWMHAVDRWLNPARMLRYPLTLCLIVFALWIASIVSTGTWQMSNGHPVGDDFSCFYMAGEMVNEGHADRLYDLDYWRDWHERFKLKPLWKKDWESFTPYFNPPHFAWVMSQFARLSYPQALTLWWALSLATFALAARCFKDWLPPADYTLAMVLAVSFLPFYFAVAGGQNTFFSLVCLTGFCWFLLREKDLPAGLSLAMVAFKPHLVILPALFLVFNKRWKALGGLVLGGAGILAFTLLTVGPEVLKDYIVFGARLGELIDTVGFQLTKQHSLHGLIYQLTGGALASGALRLISLVLTVAVLAFSAKALGKGSLDTASTERMRLSLLMALTVVLSPHLFHYDVLLMVLPAMLWLSAAKGDERIDAWTPAFKTLMLIGFVWMFIGGLFVDAFRIPVQLTPLIMLAWVWYSRDVIVHAGLRESAEISQNPV